MTISQVPLCQAHAAIITIIEDVGLLPSGRGRSGASLTQLVGSQARNPTWVWLPPDSPSHGAWHPGWFSHRHGGKVPTLLPVCSSQDSTGSRSDVPAQALGPLLCQHTGAPCAPIMPTELLENPSPGELSSLISQPHTQSLWPQHILRARSKETHTQVLVGPESSSDPGCGS